VVIKGEFFVNKVSFCGVEDGQYKSKRVVVHCIVIKYASCDKLFLSS